MKTFERLMHDVAKLRSKCPLVQKQTYASFLRWLPDEVRELKAAVRKKDYKNMKEELGDLLYHVMVYSQLAKEEGHFTIDDVVQNMVQKNRLRNPHVFGYPSKQLRFLKGKKLLIRSAQDVLRNWPILKKLSYL